MPYGPAARVGDLTSHGSPLAPGIGSTNVLIGSMPAWRALMDFHACPIVKVLVPDVGGMVMLGSPTVLINSMMACRVMDMVVEIPGGPNPIAMGATNVCIGDVGVVPPSVAAPGIGLGSLTAALAEMVAAQAQTLTTAAEVGIPFCEKCERVTDALANPASETAGSGAAQGASETAAAVAAVAPAGPSVERAGSTAPAIGEDSTAEKAPLSPSGDQKAQDKIKLVELVEVVTDNGTEKQQPTSGRKQYINLDQKDDPSAHPEYGRIIRLKARVEWVSGDKTKSLSGQNVYWYKKADGGNRAGLTGAEKEGFGSAGGSENNSTKTDAKGWTPVTEFYLSRYGGDKFDVFATEDSTFNGGLKAGSYEVWRRLFYDVVEMKTKDGTGKYSLDNAIQSRIKAGYEKVYIELTDTGKRHLGDYQDNFDTVEKGFQWADKSTAADGVPLKVHFSVIDHAAPRNGTYGATTETVEEDADNPAFVSSATIRPYDFTGHTWLVKAEYQSKTTPAVEWKVFAAGKVTLDGTRGARKFKVDFSGSGMNPSAAQKVKVRLTYLQPGSYGGWGGSDSLHLLICRGEYEDLMTVADADAQIIVACLHEPGHALGLVPASAAWHDAAHSGHCQYNTCTMWYQSSPGNETFHDEATSDPGCRTVLRLQELTKSVMQPKWKFPR